jgi:hypothetical protein
MLFEDVMRIPSPGTRPDDIEADFASQVNCLDMRAVSEVALGPPSMILLAVEAAS